MSQKLGTVTHDKFRTTRFQKVLRKKTQRLGVRKWQGSGSLLRRRRMDTDQVPLQLPLVGEILRTETASELLDASVLDEMSAKVDAGRESFAADIAVVLVDIAMSLDMLLIAV